MAETLFDIPTKDLPSLDEGTVFMGEFTLQSVEGEIAHVALTTAQVVSTNNAQVSAPKKGSMVQFLATLKALPRKHGITEEDREDERYLDLMKKHAPEYLQQHASELLD